MSLISSGYERSETSELNEACGMVKDAITSLMKISIVIRDATPRDRYIKAITSARYPFIDTFDISHVGHKFPKLSIKGQEWLRDRLGRAITQRRQYLKYCREHHERFQEPNEASKSPSNMQPEIDVFKLESESKGGTVRSLPASAFAPTDASTLQASWLKPFQAKPEELVENVSDSHSETSYATSVHDDESQSRLHPPSLEDVAQGFPFECPYCWTLQDMKTERSWR